MPVAFILVNAEIGSEDAVLKEIKKLEYVTEVYTVYGVYDIIAKVQADTMDELKNVVFSNVRRITKVRSTMTLTVY